MRPAWIGFVGAIVGALVGVFGAPVYKQWVEGPPEGLFTGQVSCIGEYDVPLALRKQINKYPCNLKIAHIDGPPIPDLTVTISSQEKLTDIVHVRNDESSPPTLSKDQKTLKLGIPSLRKNSVVHVNFTSAGNPSIEKQFIMSSGRLIDEARKDDKKPWYRDDWAIFGGIVTLLIAGTGLIYFVMNKAINRDTSSATFKSWAALAAAVALVPFFLDNLATIFIIYALVLIYENLLALKEDT
jgi:hypothetical protein